MLAETRSPAPRLDPRLGSREARSIAATLLRGLSPRLHCGTLEVQIPSGEHLALHGPQPGPRASLVVHSWRSVWRLLIAGDIGFAESYIAGEWSSSTLDALMALALRNSTVETPLQGLRELRPLLKLQHALNRNTKRGSRRNIAAHYDLGNEFYAQWLDAGMSYSAALFSSPAQTLEEAQDAKLDRVCALLDLSNGQDVLEIGCGWGSLAEHIIRRHDCALTGITLSAQQLEYAGSRLYDLHPHGFCDLRLQDYRDVRGSYDRIVSIEMLEAVGEAYWPTYFGKLRDSLRPGGLAVLQVITIEERLEGYRRRPDFIQKHIFPGGMLPTTQIIRREIAAAGLELIGSEWFGDSYARTIKEWQLRFQNAWPSIQAIGFDNRFKRAWEYYLAYCRAGFEAGTLSVGLYQVGRSAKSC
jgi:cyclopropane-fatty-acyl-phospholipid synthase